MTAPPGVLPGQPIVSLLGTTTTLEVVGSSEISVPSAPAGATHIRVTATCNTAGSFTWGTDLGGNNPSVLCSASDLGTASATAWLDFPLDADSTRVRIDADPAGRLLLSLQYLNYVPTALGRNAAGETFGVTGDGLSPDLIAVVGLDATGAAVDGYARSTDLDAFGPDWPGQPSSPEEAIKWQTERDQKYPLGWDIPVFLSDGVTQIGTFHIGK